MQGYPHPGTLQDPYGQAQQQQHVYPPPPNRDPYGYPTAGPSNHSLPPNAAQPLPPHQGVGGSNKRTAAQSILNDEDEDEKPISDTASQSGAMGGGSGTGKAKGGASEFVKKLYRMLEDGQFNDTVSWGYHGDTFVVKDMNQFTTHILPLHFKHSNFASFVRQLNKYDFHKVKQAEEGGPTYGENTWEFKHPNFRMDMKDNLENIKRKTPAAKKQATGAGRGRGGGGGASAAPASGNGSMDPSHSSNGFDTNGFQAQLDNMNRVQQAMQQHMTNLSADYQAVIGEMMNFQRNMVAQDQLMQNIIQYLVNLEADQKAAKSSQDPASPFVPSSQAQKLISSYTEVARASYDQMADLSRRASLSGGSFPPISLPPAPHDFGHFNFGQTDRRNDTNNLPPPAPAPPSSQQQQPQQPSSNSNSNPVHSPNQFQHNAPPVYDHPPTSTVPSETNNNSSNTGAGGGGGNGPSRPGFSNQRRESNVPGWAVPPRVLLVEDDSVCRKLSSKFLEVFGCDIDVAIDGVSAVNKMKMQKYDLVLMDIVMPNLDGVSATSMIRQFDATTPIVSMTSNSGPNDVMTYFSHGMTDVLPKPFTKQNLRGMLDRHLPHLKLIQQLAEVPRALGFSTDEVRDAVAQSVFTATSSEDQSQPNPFQSMGISDSDYLDILTNIATSNEGAMRLEVETDGGKNMFRTLGDGGYNA
ncbi:uncharacterized protein JCM6883_002049 [Sporobolomyces salmoneus]|uniref:uncharacterized protein n=1 Tax=Sporobolomyces salmoneus TaxID=183962 RepID=UPI00317222A3